MISPDQEAKILRFYHAEKWPIATIARQLGVHHGTVRRVLVQSGVAEVWVPMMMAGVLNNPRRLTNAFGNWATAIARLAGALVSLDLEAWSADALAGLPGLDEDEDRADELAFVREWFPALVEMFEGARAKGCVIIHETMY